MLLIIANIFLFLFTLLIYFKSKKYVTKDAIRAIEVLIDDLSNQTKLIKINIETLNDSIISLRDEIELLKVSR